MRPFPLVSVLAVVCALAAAARPARGDDDPPYVPPAFLASPPVLPPGSGDKVMRLDLTGAIAIAMRQNLGIETQRKQVRLGKLNVAEAIWSMYEPVLSLGYGHSGSQQPPATLQAGEPGSIVSQTGDNWRVSVSQKLPTGGSVSVSVNGSRLASSSGTAVEPLNYSSDVTLQVSQPLLHGFSRDLAIPQMSILTAKISSEKSRHELESNAAGLVVQTEAAYWRVVAELYAYGVAVKSQQLAEDMLALVRRRIDAGLKPSSELTGAEATLADRRLALLSSAAAVDQAWDALRLVLNLPRDQWTIPILPTDRPRFDPTELPAADVALDIALRRRPEIASAKLDLESSRLAMRAAENNALPDLNLDAGTTSYGAGSTLGGALGQLGGRTATGWSVGLSMNWTPLNRAKKINTEMQRIQNQVQVANQEQRVQGIWNEVRTALRNERAAALKVIAASKSRALTSQSLEIENHKYLDGASSNIDIATVQDHLAAAELSELGALLNHAEAATALLLATGQLLDKRHIKLEVSAGEDR